MVTYWKSQKCYGIFEHSQTFILKPFFREALAPRSREEPLALLIPLFLLLGVQLVLTLQILPHPIPLAPQRVQNPQNPPQAPPIHLHMIPLALPRKAEDPLSAPPARSHPIPPC